MTPPPSHVVMIMNVEEGEEVVREIEIRERQESGRERKGERSTESGWNRGEFHP